MQEYFKTFNIQIDKNLLNVEFNSGKKLNCKLIKFIQKYQSFKPYQVLF